MKRILLFACAYAAICLASTVTLVRAQTPQPDIQKLDAKACSDRERLTLGDTQELKGKAIPGTDGTNPGEKLARTDGVICPPPGLDANIHAPAPGGGRTPVIAPSTVEPGAQAK